METEYPEATFIVAGDFNKENRRKMLPIFYQHISVSNVSKTFKCFNFRKAVGPDSIPSCVLRAYAQQLAGVFTDILLRCVNEDPKAN